MSHIDQLRESIDARIVEVKNEMAALHAARAALRDQSATSKAPAVSANRARPSRRRRTSNAVSDPTSAETPTSAGADLDALKSAGEPTGPPQPRSRAHRKPAASARPVEVLLAGKLEIMLVESEDGLSAITISRRANASYKQVLDLLRELEQTGQVRRSGSRRTSLWRLISDEERIAERAAELERVSIGTSAT
jgi:hypothetical protein